MDILYQRGRAAGEIHQELPLNLPVINTVDPTLAQAAEDAVRQWHYQPTLLNGQPVEVVTTITLNFSLR